MPEQAGVKRALISVYDKTGIVDFARALHDEFGVEILSTGGTARALTNAGIPVTLVEEVTGFPEMMDGRVKTLHPKIHAAILADRDNPEHMRQLVEQGIEPIDMVVVNLYPFEETVANPECTFEQAIEMIDIGGPCLLRAAAKNHKHVLVIPEYGLLDYCLTSLRTSGGVDAPVRRHFAQWVFSTTEFYDGQIRRYLSDVADVDTQVAEDVWGRRGEPSLCLSPQLSLASALRYGENPHQSGALYELDDERAPLHRPTLTGPARGEMSFNNYADASAALELCVELAREISNEPRASARAVPRPERAPDVTKAFDQPDSSQPAWLLTWTTYGSWLPGDERGFVSRQRDDDAKHRIHNLPGTHYSAAQQDLEESARERMQGHPVKLGEAEARTAFDAFVEAANAHQIVLLAVSVMADHVHVLCQGAQDGGELLRLLKGVSARRLGQRHTMQDAPRWWTKSGSRRHIKAREDLTAAIEYVRGQQGELVSGWFGGSWEGEPSRDCSTARAEARGSLSAYVCCFIKHTNACGAAIDADPVEAYRRAYLGDPNAAMGGILAVNFPVDRAFAETVMNTYQNYGKPLREAGAAHAPGGFFVEVWLAPAFDDDAVRIIRGEVEGQPQKGWGERVRLLAVGDMVGAADSPEMDFKRIAGGMLVQDKDLVGLNEDEWRVATERQPTDAEMDDLRLAWLVCKHTKSNAITICKDGMLIGNGAGQMSRVMSCRIATWAARENGHADALPGAVAASDAFFPFRDGPDILMQAGVTAIIQPGGSKRDADTIAACEEAGVAMVFTGKRHFRH